MTDDETRAGKPERREFFGTAATAVGVAGMSACSGLLGRGEEPRWPTGSSAAEIEAFLTRLDQGLETIDNRSGLRETLESMFGPDALDPSSAESRARLDHADALGRRFLRALLVAGMVHDLSPEARASDSTTENLARMNPELDSTVVEAARLVATCPRWVRRRFQRMLRDDPDLVMRFFERLDSRGRGVGLGRGGRSKLRQVGSHLSGRLRRQPPSLLIDECLDKVERTAAQHGVDVALWRQLTGEAPRHALWSDPAEGGGRWAKSPEDGSAGDDTGPNEGGEEAAEESLESSSNPSEDGAANPAAGDGAVAPGVDAESGPISEPSVAELIQALDSSDPTVRFESIQALSARRAAEAVPALSRVLRSDSRPDLRGWALRALSNIGTPEARRAMDAAHDDASPEVRELAAYLAPRPTTSPSTPASPAAPTTDRDVGSSQRSSLLDEYAHQEARRGPRAIGIAAASTGGVGAVVLGVGSAGYTGYGDPGDIAMTVGTVLLGLGLILMIVSLVVYASRRRRSRLRGGANS